MQRGLRAHLRGNLVGYVALFVALGGTAFAAGVVKLPANSVGTSQLRNGAVTGAKVAHHTLTGANINVATLGTVPNASRLGHRSPSAFQARISGGCTATNAIAAVAASGGVSCVPTGTITSVTAGSGLTGGASSGPASLAVNPASVQNRVTGTCSSGAAVSSINQDGTVACTSPAYLEAHVPGPMPEFISAGSAISFSIIDAATNILLTSAGTVATISTAGTYALNVTLVTSTSAQFAYDINGTLTPVPPGSGTTTRILPLGAGDTVSVVNDSAGVLQASPGCTLELIRLG